MTDQYNERYNAGFRAGKLNQLHSKDSFMNMNFSMIMNDKWRQGVNEGLKQAKELAEKHSCNGDFIGCRDEIVESIRKELDAARKT